MAWILAAHDEDQLQRSSEPPTDAEGRRAFAHEAVQKREPYFNDETAPERHEPAGSD